jgi:hypothetical protein
MKAGREFELLITRIEQALVPAGAIVKSPDRIKDKVTGQLREVDASITYQFGSTPILITIECRDRKSKPDKRWIEELTTKKRDIGANSTLAVSVNGFTEPAVIAANNHDIVLKQFHTITDSDLTRWAENLSIVVQRRKPKNIVLEFSTKNAVSLSDKTRE